MSRGYTSTLTVQQPMQWRMEGQESTPSSLTSLPKFCSNYKAEGGALSKTAEVVCISQSDCRQVVFFTDALLVMEALSGDRVGQTERQTPASLPGTPSDSSVGILSLWYPGQ